MPIEPRPLLLIGAMKGGTTSLFRNLSRNLAIATAPDKEPNAFVAGPLSSADLRSYLAMFSVGRSSETRYLLDASTAYTKRPEHENVAEHVVASMGAERPKVIYMVREPISRAISHYRHDRARRFTDLDIDSALLSESIYTDWGRYAFQLEPWLHQFGAGSIHVTSLEVFKQQPQRAWKDLAQFLALPFNLDAGLPNENTSATAHPATGLLAAVRDSGLYRSSLRPLLSEERRTRIRTRIAPRRTTPSMITPETRATLSERFEGDADALCRLLRVSQPPWEVGS